MTLLELFVVATECSRASGLPDPGFGLEQPEDPERWAGIEADNQPRPSWDLQKHRPASGFASFWSSPEWKALESEYGLQMLHFDQGPVLHAKRKPTTFATNMTADSCLIGCRGPGTEAWNPINSSIKQSKAWATWLRGW